MMCSPARSPRLHLPEELPDEDGSTSTRSLRTVLISHIEKHIDEEFSFILRGDSWKESTSLRSRESALHNLRAKSFEKQPGLLCAAPGRAYPPLHHRHDLTT